jgi:Cu(I)/Ag(I) efflux system membrane fusion protein
MTFQKEIANKLQHAEHFSNLEAIRKEYLQLSKTMIEMVYAFKPMEKSLYIIHCTMANNAAGADWLSNSKEIENPFYGKAMLTCGNIKEEIKQDF